MGSGRSNYPLFMVLRSESSQKSHGTEKRASLTRMISSQNQCDTSQNAPKSCRLTAAVCNVKSICGKSGGSALDKPVPNGLSVTRQ